MPPTWGGGGKSWRDPLEGPLSLPCPCTLGIFAVFAVCAGHALHFGELATNTYCVAVACMIKSCFCEVWVDGCKCENI